MFCAGALDSLFKVVITGAVSHSAISNITLGETVTMSFLVSPDQPVRIVEGHPVQDGIAPYPVCVEDFSLKFADGIKFYLDKPPKPLVPPTTPTPPPELYFALMKSRPVFDGAWVSYSANQPDDVPLLIHGTYSGSAPSTYSGVFGFNSAQFTFPSLEIAKAVGTYTPSGAKHTMSIWRDWAANKVLAWDVKSMKISKAV